jgi:hypothetical protein
LSFNVAACARPMIAGESASQDAAAVDVLMNTRRLTDAIGMASSPAYFLFRREHCRGRFVSRTV